MIDRVAALTKSNVGVLGGTFKSKKFSLASIWVVACLGFPEQVPAWSGAAVICAYCLSQGLVEAAAAWGASVLVEENGNGKATATITAAKPVGGTGG